MRILLLQLDGKLPNLALMRIAHHHRMQGDEVELRHAGNPTSVRPRLDDQPFDKVYGSLIFESTRGLAEHAMQYYPNIELGGTGWDLRVTLADVGIEEGSIAGGYQHYPKFHASIGFSQRGCRLECDFCVVPRKEGKPRHAQTINEIWRGGHNTGQATMQYVGKVPDGYEVERGVKNGVWSVATRKRWIILLDNDFFGGPHWIDRHAELVAGKFRVDLTQGINARALNKETALAMSQLDYRSSNMSTRRLYTAWDNVGHEKPLMRGLELLAKNGVKPDHIMVYMLIGKSDSHADREHRRQQLRAFGCRPYPMPYVRTPELVGFQRWVIGAYDKRISWADWEAADYSPRKLGKKRSTLPLFPEIAAVKRRVTLPMFPEPAPGDDE